MNLEALRSIKLPNLLLALGCSPDVADKKNWKTPIGRLTVTGQKFYCHDCSKGGGGAIDLVMLLNTTDFKGAVAWLSAELGKVAVDGRHCSWKASEAAKKMMSEIPAPVDANWPRVRRYLSETRCLDQLLIDKLHDAGRIYADVHANAVFLLGKGEGAELRGTGQQKFHGARGLKSPFILSTLGPLKVAFLESAVDALSLRTIGFTGEVVSLAGNANVLARELAIQYRSRGYVVMAAFDADVAGERMAEGLGISVERLLPLHGCKDWNEALCAQKANSFSVVDKKLRR